MGTNGGTIISFTSPSLHAVTSRMSSHPNGCANFTFQIPSIANASKKNTNSAERRANHNAVERARRECLNTKFQELAHALPSLTQVRRPSKSIIVQKSLDFIYTARQKDELHDKEMRSIRSENESLREEINKLREQLGLDPLPPREEPKPITSQQTDDAKEDANKNKPEIKAEADNPTTASVHEPKSSTDVQIKSEDSRSDDDCSNGNTDDDYEQDPSETTIDGKNVEADQTKQHIENQPCLYNDLVYLGGLNHHTGYTASEFDFPMDMTPMGHLVNANSLNLNFDDSLNAHEMGAFCGSFPVQQKYYPSPPYEAAMIDISGQIPFSMSPEHSHM